MAIQTAHRSVSLPIMLAAAATLFAAGCRQNRDTDSPLIPPAVQADPVAQASAFTHAGQYSDALPLLDQAIRDDPNNHKAWYQRGITNHQLRNLQASVRDFSRAIVLNTEFREAFDRRAAAYSLMGKRDLAIADKTESIRIKPTAEAYSDRGLLLTQQGDLKSALSDFDKAIECDPNYYKSYLHRGIVFAQQREFVKALADYNLALRLTPNSGDCLYARGIAYSHLGQLDQAIADFSAALEIQPRNVQAYIKRGLAYGKLGEFQKAVADNTAAIELDVNNPLPYHNRGAAYHALGEAERARADLKRAEILERQSQGAN